MLSPAIPHLQICNFHADLCSQLPSPHGSLATATELIKSAPHDVTISAPLYSFLFYLTRIPDNIPRRQQILELLPRWPAIIITNPEVLEPCAKILVLTVAPDNVKAGEAAIWDAVDHLLAVAFSQHNTPPVSSPVHINGFLSTPQNRKPSEPEDISNDTPVHANTGLLPPSTKTHAENDPYLRSELRDTVLRDVHGFHTFFPNVTEQDWNCAVHCSRTCNNPSHKNNRSSELPADILQPFPQPTEASVVNWFTNLNQHLSNRCFYSSGTKPLGDSPSNRQCDLFLSPPTTTSTHSWYTVLVPAQLKPSAEKDCTSDTIVQLAAYVREVFGAQVNRRFVHAFTICGPFFRCFLFDRAGVSISQRFNIRKNEKTLALVVRILLSYATMTPQQLGFDPSYTTQDGTPFMPSPNLPLPQYLTFRGRRFRLIDKLFHRPVIVSRGTLCWLAQEEKDDEESEDREHGKYQERCVIKDSWRTSCYIAEGELLNLAASRHVWGIPEAIMHGPVTFAGNTFDGTNSLRSHLSFATARRVILAQKHGDGMYLLSTTGSASVHVGGTPGAGPGRTAPGSRPTQPTPAKRPGQEDPSANHPRKLAKREIHRPRAGGTHMDQTATPKTSRQPSAQVSSTVGKARSQSSRIRRPSPPLPQKPKTPQIVEFELEPDLERANPVFSDLTHSIIISRPVGKRIEQFSSLHELLFAFRDAILCHQSLVEAGGILHRDISPNNIMIASWSDSSIPPNAPKGFLIDLDLAKQLDPLPNHRPSPTRRRTGTMMFMAIQVLECTPRHTYRHDLESFFYVLIWLCISAASDSDSTCRTFLSRSWACQGAASKKYFQMADDKKFDELLGWFAESMQGLTDLVTGIRDVLFPLKGRGVETGTFNDRSLVYKRIVGLIQEAIEDLDLA